MPRIDISTASAPAKLGGSTSAIVAIAATFLGVVSYVLLLDVPWIRATAWPMFVVAGGAAITAIVLARTDERDWVRWAANGNLGCVLLAGVWFFWVLSLPTAEARASTMGSAPNFTLADQTGESITLDTYRGGGPILLVFYRGSWCPFCSSELRGLGAAYDDFRKAGIRILAISTDASGKSAQATERLGLKFPLLSDVDAKVIRDYGLLHRGGGPDGGDVSLPANFLVGADGRILWRRVAGRVQDRLDPQEILKAARDAGATNVAANR